MAGVQPELPEATLHRIEGQPRTPGSSAAAFDAQGASLRRERLTNGAMGGVQLGRRALIRRHPSRGPMETAKPV